MNILSLFRGFAVATLLCAAVSRGGHAADLCNAPEDLAGVPSSFPHVAAVLKPGGSLSVLTVGSATVFSPVESLQAGTLTSLAMGLSPNRTPNGVQPSVTEKAFPLQMAHDIEQAYPGLTVTVTVKGGRGITASEMLDIMHTEMAARKYQMVIWQTGTVEAVRNIAAGLFYQTLADGAAEVNQAGADLVLVDPQFSRFLHANANLDPYNQALQQIAGQADVILFHRFDLMRHWANEGQIDLERTPKGQRLAAVEALHACLGQALAKLVLASTKLPS